jgi:2-haloacid dehalogenase
MTDIKALVFDAYGTIFDVHSIVVECESRFPGQGSQLSVLWRSKQLEYTWLRSLMGRYVNFEANTRMALLAACRMLKLELSDEASNHLVGAYRMLKVFADVPGPLALLSGKARAILSNGSPDMLAAVVRNAGLERHFDAVLSVDDLEIYKPHPSVYAFAARRLNVRPEEVGFVSSNFWDVAGAASFGFRTFWINRNGNPPEELGFEPFAVFRSFDQLPSMLA